MNSSLGFELLREMELDHCRNGERSFFSFAISLKHDESYAL